MITLKPMTSDEYRTYIVKVISVNAKQMAISNRINEKVAMDITLQDFMQRLPNNEKTENNYLFTIYHEDKPVGMIWIWQRGKQDGYIHEIFIDEEYRELGYGEAAMKEIEDVAKELGIKKISLHVLGQNRIARKLYDKLGYEETNIFMAKRI